MAASGDLGSVVCLEMTVKNDQFPRVKRLHQRFQPTLEKLKQDMSKAAHVSSRDVDKLLFIPLRKSKVYVFSTERQRISRFLNVYNIQHEVVSEHVDAKSLQKSMNEDCKNGLLVVPVVLISEEDMNGGTKQRINFMDVISSMPESFRCFLTGNILTIMMFSVNSKEDMQRCINRIIALEPGIFNPEECKGSRVFHQGDETFLDMVSRKIERCMFDQLQMVSTLDDLLILLVPDQNDAEQGLNAVFKNANKLINIEMDLNKSEFVGPSWKAQNVPERFGWPKERIAYIQAFNWHVIEKLGNEILSLVFGRHFIRKELEDFLMDSNAKCKSEAIKSHLYSYFESYIFGMLWGIAGNQRLRLANWNINSTIWRENNKRAVINDVRRGSISVEILNEIGRLASFIDVLLKWKFEIENIMKKNPLKDEIPFEAQISLSRIPGVKAFGISNKTFTVSIDEEKFKNSNQMVKVVKEAVGKLFPVDNSTLKPWKQPIFHIKCGGSIKGDRIGRITMFTEIYGSDKILDDLYFLTCKHVASDPKTEVYMHCTQCKTQSCLCEKPVLGINMYPFGPEKKNIFGAYIDFTCGLVVKTVAPGCDINPRNKYHKLIEISGIPDSTEDHVGQKTLIWTDSKVNTGEYDGVQYFEVRENDGFRRVDIIRSTQNSFGGPGESGSLLYLLSERTDASDVITPMFVYCGQWEDNKFFCFRFQEGLDCLASEYVLNFRLCYENQKERPSLYISGPRKRIKNYSPVRST